MAGYSIANAGLQEPWEMSSDLDSRIKENPDDALYGAIKAYDLVRTNKTKDRHLFLVTKWDLYANEPSPQFAAPIANGVDAYLGDRYSKSWSAFLSMRVSREAKWYMPHCSGIIAGNNVKKLGKISETRVDKYGKVLWNWLYANAAAPNIAPEMALFPEVVPPKPSFINKLLFGVTAR